MTKALCLIILLALSTISLINCHAAHDKVSSVHPLPSKVLMGYASSNYTNVINAVTDDLVNVVIWAFADIRVDELAPFTATHRDLSLNSAAIVTNLNLTAVKSTIEHLNDNGYSIHHLVSVGGWNGHHLDTQISASLWMDMWQSSELSDIFHGIDWDLEGSDDLTSEENVFTVDCLDKMGEISRLMKQAGYIVTIAPPQSYLNNHNPNFSRYVNLSSPTRAWHPEFHYLGSNVYAYLLANYNPHIDLISIQFYESYSDAAMAVHHYGTSPQDYIVNYIQDLANRQFQFYVDFSQDNAVNMGAQFVSLPLNKLVIGLANGWALDNGNTEKVLYISPEQVQNAFVRLQESNSGDLSPRGFMFWTIEERGTNGVYLAKGLGQFLHDKS